MRQLVGAEALKLRTTRAWIGVLVAVLAISGIGAAATVGVATELELGDRGLSESILSSSLIAGFLAFLLGITTVTSEWRHGTITRTFLATPRRARVFLAKEITGVLVGLVLAAVGVLVVLAVAVPWLELEGSSFALDRDVAELLLRIVLAASLWGALGVGVGAVVQSQAPALVAAIVWVVIAEALIGALLGLVDLDGVADYLPGQALGVFEGGAEDGLSPWASGAVGLVWVIAIGGLGLLRMARRDVT